MSRNEAVRTPLRHLTGGRHSRTPDERLYVRFPALLPRLVSAVMRLPLRSRPRRAMLSLVARRGWAASDRGDLDLCLRAYDRDVEILYPESGTLAFPDLRGTYRGHDGFREVWRTIHEPWEVEVQLQELIDAGQRLLLIGQTSPRGKTSGIRVSTPLFQVVSFRSGRIIREEFFNSREEALEAAGLSE
jgi:ketosteroid isomerase-like protein